jgi:hypothetical protein
MTKQEYIDRYGIEVYKAHIEKRRLYYKEHKEHCLEMNKRYTLQNKEKVDEKNKHWRDNNKERHYQSTKKCREKNIEWNLNRICTDLRSVENYELAVADKFKGWILHHRFELHSDYSLRYSKEALIKIDLYYHRPPEELIFVPVKEHVAMHAKTRKLWNEEHKGVAYGK